MTGSVVTVGSDDDYVRKTLALALEEAVAALERLRRRGTWGKRLAS